MDIKQAKNLSFGDKIKFPADRGTPAGIATVKTYNGGSSHQLCEVHKTIAGIGYIWVQTDKGVWPSNRIEVQQ